MTTKRKELIERNRKLNARLIQLNTSHGMLQRVGPDNRTGSPGCGLTRTEISERCAKIREEMETVRAERDLVRNQIEALDKRPTRAATR